MKTNISIWSELFTIKPGTWIEKVHSDFMMSLQVVQFKDTNLRFLQGSRASFTSKKITTRETFNTNTWRKNISRFLSSLKQKFLFLVMMGFFPWLLNSRRIEVSQSWEKKKKKGQSWSPDRDDHHHHWFFPKDNNELQGCALCHYFMMVIGEHLKLYVIINLNVTINRISNKSHCGSELRHEKHNEAQRNK